jgi:hypothetical protein
MFRETGRLVRALSVAGIPSLALKGVALALTVYPDASLRNFGDIDILVDQENLGAARMVAYRCGYQPEHLELEPRKHHLPPFIGTCEEDILTGTLAVEYDPSLTPETIEPYRHSVMVELHRGLFIDLSAVMRGSDMGVFWESPQFVLLPDGTPMRIMAPEAMIVHLCAHAGQHGFDRLIYPLDVALVVQSYKALIDWARVADIARRCGEQRSTLRTLEWVRRRSARSGRGHRQARRRSP